MGDRHHPVRMFAARTVYWALWGPPLAVALPFALLGWLVDWLSQTAFPKVADIAQPAWGAAHDFALKCGNRILGFSSQKDPRP